MFINSINDESIRDTIKSALNLTIKFIKNGSINPNTPRSWDTNKSKANPASPELALLLVKLTQDDKATSILTALQRTLDKWRENNSSAMPPTIKKDLNLVYNSVLATLKHGNSEAKNNQTYLNIVKHYEKSAAAKAHLDSQLNINVKTIEHDRSDSLHPEKILIPALLLARVVSGNSTYGSRYYITNVLNDFVQSSNNILSKKELSQLTQLQNQLECLKGISILDSAWLENPNKSKYKPAVLKSLEKVIKSKAETKASFSVATDIHSMILQIEKNKNAKLIITLHNSNGRTYDPKIYNNYYTDRKTNEKTQHQKINNFISIDASEYLTKDNGVNELAQKIVESLSKNDYETFSSDISNLGNAAVGKMPRLTRTQKGGVCTVDSLLALFRNELDINLYRKFKSYLLRTAALTIQNADAGDIRKIIKEKFEEWPTSTIFRDVDEEHKNNILSIVDSGSEAGDSGGSTLEDDLDRKINKYTDWALENLRVRIERNMDRITLPILDELERD